MRIKKRFVLASFIIAGLMVWVAAVADLLDRFELGSGVLPLTGTGDILGDANPPDTQPGPDWADLFDTDGVPVDVAALFGGEDAVFIGTNNDFPFRPGDDLGTPLVGYSTSGPKDFTVFAKGSNKNNHLIGTWTWATGDSPPKDDVANAYAYATMDSNDDLLIYIGLERITTDGASHVDFELNQSEIGLDNVVPCPENSCGFTGAKTEGDILVVMDFERGGALGLVEIMRWEEVAPATFEWVLLFKILPDAGGKAEGCNKAFNGFDANIVCAVNNDTAIDGGPWPNFNRSGQTITDIEPNAFTEVGVNLTALLDDTPCLSTVQVKSRSSASFNSELKDFAFGKFDLCGSITIIKEAIPEGSQEFQYSGDLGAFSLVDDGSATSTTTFSNLLPDTYTVIEGGPPAGWELTGLACDPPAITRTDLGNATAGIDLDFGDDATCTFTNTELGQIIIDKVTIPSGDSQIFTFTPQGYGDTFTLTDAAEPNDTLVSLLPGTYTVTLHVP
jgi:hypothetical protein